MPETFLSIVMFALIATISPGGATTLATASGVQFGYIKSIPLMLGISVGLATLVAVAATGLTSLILAVPSLSLMMKILGSGYLFWLALKILRAKRSQDSSENNMSPIGFTGGFFLLLVNPKAWAMAFSVAASFSSIFPNLLQFALFTSIIFGVSCSLSLSLWCKGGAVLARRLKTDRHWQMLNVVLALLLVGSILPIWI